MTTIEALFLLCIYLGLPFAVLTFGAWYLDRATRQEMATMIREKNK